MGPIIRPAGAADIPAITAIYERAVLHGTASFEIEPPNADEMARRQAALLAGGHPYLVAEEAGAVLAYAYAGPYRPRPAYRWTVEDSVYVAPDRQGSGIGRALLAALIAASAERGFRQMVAVIGDPESSTGSVRLHAALGFRRVGAVEAAGFKHGRWRAVLLMQRALGEGAATAPGQSSEPGSKRLIPPSASS